MGSGSWATWVVVALIGFGIYKAFKAGKAGPQRHCMTCGTDAPAETKTRGSIWIEIILWLMFIVPGLIYSIWRLTTRRQVCSACGAENIVPLDAPAAQSHRKALTGG
jgi:hypothetical protein